MYDCTSQKVIETCDTLKHETLLYQDGQKGLCQQMYVPTRVAKCVSEVELQEQMGDLREFMRVAGAFPAATGEMK